MYSNRSSESRAVLIADSHKTRLNILLLFYIFILYKIKHLCASEQLAQLKCQCSVSLSIRKLFIEM